jgi:hypothetical protein
MKPATTHKGKIGTLPLAVREELNRRLRDGDLAPKILPWLNKEAGLRGRGAVTAQNLSAWRLGGYQEWLKEQARVDQLQRLSELAFRLAKAGDRHLSDGAAAIAAGKILDLLEQVDGGEEAGEAVAGLSLALAKLRDADARLLTAGVNQSRLAQKDQELKLARQKFERETAEMFLKWWGKKEAEQIVQGREAKTVKVEKLKELIFGKDPHGEDRG